MSNTTLSAPAPPEPAPGGTGAAGAVTTAPYSLVRVTALARPPDGPEAARHRELTERLVAALVRAGELGPALVDALHACAGTEDPGFHRRVVLPLRRDVHNRRTPKPAVRAALGGLPGRIDLLRRWLDARDDVDRLLGELAAAVAPALAADRRALAAACRTEPLRRAATMVGSRDLLHALDRAAAQGDAPDARARKSEPTVLRYAVRASTRTVPLT
ncbi:MAG TPA: hypothetical protein VD813_07065, partial [Pseudonocardia sp.]|nr:hypothetical protein [Pseudonocardia sp.]